MKSTDSSFENIKCFSDLVEANLKFLNGELSETPLHGGPLNKESQLIIEPMRAMCSELRLITVCSQPAYVKLMRRQRGYVHLFVQTSRDVTTIVEELSQCNLVCSAARVGSHSWGDTELWDKSKENCDISQVRPPGATRWTGVTDFRPSQKSPSNCLQWFDTDGYSPSQDTSLVMVETADDDWGYGVDHCISKTHCTIRRLLESS